MSKTSHKALASATVMSLVLTSTLAATNVQAAAEVTRMPGADRYTTAQTVAKQSFKKAENVILVNGLGYADSVSATPFAKLKNAPILLTDASNKPSAELTATLTELGAKNIYIVGGKGVVTEAIEKELAKNYTVERIGGTSRYETNAEIAKKVLAETKAEKAVLVNGQDGYADALSVASIAATKGYPVVFGNTNNVPTVVKDAVKDVKEVLAVGGEAVLPDTVLKTVEAKRIAKGADRFDTNLKVLEHFNADFNFENIFVAAGGDDSSLKFADALVASAAAAKHGAPVVLTGLGANKENVEKSVNYTKGKMGDNTKVTIVGGTASVSEAIEKDLKGEKESNGKAEVQSIEAVNLNQIKVVFSSKVDEDTAEDVRNYELDGTQLQDESKKGEKDGDAVADLQDDEKTVIITLANKEGQEKEKNLNVRKGILTEDKSKLVKEKEVKIRFKDTTAPTIKKVEAKGNRKVTIEFSEAIFVNENEEYEALNKLADEFEINDETINKIGFEADYSEAKNSVKAKDGGFYINKAEFYLEETLPSGTNKLFTPDGKDGEYLADASGWTIKEKTIDFKVGEVTGKPKVKTVKGGTDGKIFINFDRAMDKKSLKECEIRLNEDVISADKIELKEGDTQIKLSGVENVRTGSNTIEINDKLKDAYGNKIEDELRVTFTASKDEAKPKVSYVLTVDDNTIRVIYSKDVSEKVAKEKGNYTLRDSKGNKVSIDEVEKISGDTYDVISNEKLDGSKYTLKIEDVIDLAGNVMDDYTATINGSEVTPIVDEVVNMGKDKDKDKERIAILFGQEMKSSTTNKVDNYKYKDADGKVRDLPSDSKIITSRDGKAAKIELPEAYVIGSKGEKIEKKSASNIVTAIVITKNVESSSGIKMDADETHDIKKSSVSSVKIDSEPMTLKKDNSDVISIEIKYTGSLDQEGNSKDFQFKAGDKTITADKVNVKGDYLVAKFTDADQDLIERAGADVELVGLGEVTDFAGRDIKKDDLSKDKFKRIYHNEIAPELLYEKDKEYINVKKGDKAGDKDWAVNIAKGEITVKFNTKLDKNSAHKNDFTFISTQSSTLEVKSAEVKDNTIIYTLNDEGRERLQKSGKDKAGLTHEITVTPKDSQRIESKEDLDGNSKEFKVKTTEKNQKLKFKVTVTEADLKDKSEDTEAEAVKNAEAAIAKAKESKTEEELATAKTEAKELINKIKDEAKKAELNKELDAIKVGEDKETVTKIVKVGPAITLGKKAMVAVELKGEDVAKYEVYYGEQKMNKVEDGIFSIELDEEVTQEVAQNNVRVEVIK